MSESAYLKGSCKRCGNHIEFPEAARGRVINCPHCGQATELSVDQPSASMEDAGDANTDAALKPKHSSTPLLIGICVLVAGLAAGAIFFLKQHHTAPVTASATPTETAVQPTASQPGTQPATPPSESIGPLQAGKIQLEKTPGTSLVYVVGTVTNDSDHERFGVTIQLELLNRAGAKVGNAQDYTSNLQPHSNWKFHALVTDSGTTSARVKTITEQ
jgi:hypothetical protein